jgi:CXXX repeat peptide maturase
VLSDTSSPSFCYYTRENTSVSKQTAFTKKKLEATLGFAESKGLCLNVIRGSGESSDSNRAILDNVVNATFYSPISSPFKTDSDIVIINDDDADEIRDLGDSAGRNMILRMKKAGVSKLSAIVESLFYKCKRINLILLDLHTYGEEDLRMYRGELDAVSNMVAGTYKIGNPIELGFLSDRVLLTGMNNCNAGIDHVTVAPNGRFYICPGFYYDDEANSIGDLEHGIHIPNEQLLAIDRAPICSICDAFQCKRCVYLNKKSTLEINTPSYQQCATSHIEREVTRELVASMGDIEPFRNASAIEELDYIDPLLVLMGKATKRTQKDKKALPRKNTDDIDTESVRSLLSQILATQEEILALIKDKL